MKRPHRIGHFPKRRIFISGSAGSPATAIRRHTIHKQARPSAMKVLLLPSQARARRSIKELKLAAGIHCDPTKAGLDPKKTASAQTAFRTRPRARECA